MKVVACYSLKGGVGKTAAAVNFAFAAAEMGDRVLLIDLDPQGASSYYYGAEPSSGIKGKLFSSELSRLQSAIKHTPYENLSILPANLGYRNLDVTLKSMTRSKQQLKKLLKPLKDDYDLIFLDCPPSLSVLSENVFNAADLILIPVIPTTLSERTLNQVNEFFEKNDYDGSKLAPFLSMVNVRAKLHKQTAMNLRENHKNLLKGYIPQCAAIEKMGVQKRPVLTYGRSHIGGKSYLFMWEEIRKRLG